MIAVGERTVGKIHIPGVHRLHTGNRKSRNFCLFSLSLFDLHFSLTDRLTVIEKPKEVETENQSCLLTESQTNQK